MSNRRKADAASGDDAAGVFGLFRSQCSKCGSDQLRWMSGHEAVGRGVDAAGAAGVMGCAVDDLTVWQCRACGEVGAFGRAEFDGFG